MIVITGPGRSGTSLLAHIYQELGFNPIVGGGGWDPVIRGGLEDVEVGRLNGQLISELGMRSSVWRLADAVRRGRGARGASPNDHAVTARGSMSGSRALSSLITGVAARTTGRHIRLLRWERVPSVVARHGAEMRRLAASREVVKDPAFCQTLWLWAAANAQINHVVVSLRALDATVAGLLGAGHLPPWAHGMAQNEVTYRLGLLWAALAEHRISYSVLRFPDFLDDADALYDALQFPEPVTRQRLLEVFDSLRRPELVSSWT